MFKRSDCVRVFGLGLIVGLGFSAGCKGAQKTLKERASVELEPCQLGQLRGTQLCTYLPRPRDAKDKSAGEIPIAVTVIESWGTKASKQPPLFMLAGGPGQGARETFARSTQLLRAWSKQRDIVLVDIRGTGDSDRVACKDNSEEDYSISPQKAIDLQVERLKSCLTRMDKRRPHHYFTPVLADDLDAVRAALGYERISLYGGSYGTRLAMEYARRHDPHVHALVLDGVAPVQLALPWHYPESFQASWNKISDYCEADPACKRRFPELRSALSRLKAQVEATPDKVYSLNHPSRDRKVEAKLDSRAVPSLYFPAAYSPLMWTMIPLAVDKALQGQWEATLALLDQAKDIEIEPLVLLSIVCNEDYRVWQGKDRSGKKNTLLGDLLIDQYEATCALFKSDHPLPKHYFEPIHSDKPTLFLSGEADPVTPPLWADKARQGFANALALTVPFTGHNTVNTRCVQGIVNEFLASDTPLSVDSSCIKDTPAPFFFTSINGPSHDFEAAQSLAPRPKAQQAKVTP